MINGDLPMHSHKRLTFEVDLRMCAGIVILKKKKQHAKRGNTTGLFIFV